MQAVFSTLQKSFCTSKMLFWFLLFYLSEVSKTLMQSFCYAARLSVKFIEPQQMHSTLKMSYRLVDPFVLSLSFALSYTSSTVGQRIVAVKMPGMPTHRRRYSGRRNGRLPQRRYIPAIALYTMHYTTTAPNTPRPRPTCAPRPPATSR